MDPELERIVRTWRIIKGVTPEQEASIRSALAGVLANTPEQDPHGLFLAGMKYLYQQSK
jgi:hypothetical protein